MPYCGRATFSITSVTYFAVAAAAASADDDEVCDDEVATTGFTTITIETTSDGISHRVVETVPLTGAGEPLSKSAFYALPTATRAMMSTARRAALDDHRQVKSIVYCRNALEYPTQCTTEMMEIGYSTCLTANFRPEFESLAHLCAARAVKRCKNILEAANAVGKKPSKYGDNWAEDTYNLLRDPPIGLKPNASSLARHHLWLVSRIVGWAQALLVLFAFEVDFVRKLNELQRTQLLTYLLEHRDSGFAILRPAGHQ
ncbi:MAG: hypothetical protein Q9170_005240 [Blastenia crenularia]